MASNVERARPDSYTASNGITLLPGGYLSEMDRDADIASAVAARNEARLAGFDLSFEAQQEFAHEPRPRSLVDDIRDAIAPLASEEFDAAKAPHPHVFEGNESGMFPRNEVSIIGGPGREGKTSAIVGICMAGALGESLAGMVPRKPITSVILSAEDNRIQYARKVAAQGEPLSPADKRAVRDRVRILDFDAPALANLRQLVHVFQNQPMINMALVEGLIEALQPLTDPDLEAPLAQIFIETVSTISDAQEDNVGHRVLAAAAKRLARDLGVAVILSHHTSQASAQNLRTLDVSSADIRGGTALVANTRQSWLLVNLGSELDPFPDSDSRTALRKLVGRGSRDRISALICLDSSKCMDPPPVFFRWERSTYGTRQVQVTPPIELAGLHWRRVHRMLNGARADARQTARDEKQQIEMKRVVATVQRLHDEGRQPSAKAVSTALGRAPGWSTPHLGLAVSEGLLVATEEHVPRTRGLIVIYRPRADS